MFDTLNEIWATLSHNKLRTSLTGFAVSWGIFMLIALLGAGNGLLNAFMNNRFEVETHSMQIWPGRLSKPYKGMKEGTASNSATGRPAAPAAPAGPAADPALVNAGPVDPQEGDGDLPF